MRRPQLPPGFLRAAYYFGDECPLNFWSSESADGAGLAAIRDDGFNAVAIVVPWTVFQPGVVPIRFNGPAFDRLVALLDRCAAAGLQAVLRVGFLWGWIETAQWPDVSRVERLYTDAAVVDAWVAYIARLHAVVGGHPAVRLAFLSWEDLWSPVLNAYPSWTREKRRTFLRDAGFERFARERHSAAELARLSGGAPGCPEPEPQRPSFRLWLEYLDATLADRLHARAVEAYPGIGCEARTDWDPLAEPGGAVEYYVHDTGYRLSGALVPVAYYSVSMGGLNVGDRQPADETLHRMEATLADVERRAGRPFFVAQFAFVDNAPGTERNTAVLAADLERFLDASAGPLRRHCCGYAVWTWRDYAVNLLHNPSFALGLEGWEARGVAVAAADGRGAGARLARGAAIAQSVPAERDLFAAIAPTLTLEVDARDESARPVTLAARVAAAAPFVEITAADGVASATFAHPGAGALRLEVTITSPGEARLGSVRLFNFVQSAGVRTRDGRGGPLCAALRRLNAGLAADPGA